MADLRTDLERIGRRVEPTGDALERLEERRRRKERNRRLAAGSLALAIAIGGSIVAYTALRDSDPGITGIADGSPPPAVPDVARVSCDGSSTVVESSVIELDPETGEVLAMWSSSVRPQADGVHILVTNTSDIDLSLQFRDLGGDNAPVGEHEVVWPIAPGPVELRCLDPYSQDAGAPGGYVELEVVDPDAIYVPIALECDNQVGWYADFAPGATGDPDPVQSARDDLHGLEPDDVVEAAGYPEAVTRQVRVVRDGEVIAVVEFFPDGQGGWLQMSGNACEGGIT